MKAMYCFLLIFVLATPAIAQPRFCADRAAFLERLKTLYKEAPVGMGLTKNGRVLEITASKDGSWTIIVTMPNGLSCGVASGMSWESTAKVQITDPDA